MPKPQVLEAALDQAPDPDLARVAFERVGLDPSAAQALAQPRILPVAARLLGFSTAAADFLSQHPDEVTSLEDVSSRNRSMLDVELASEVEAHGHEAGLRRFRRRAMLRVAARDLGGAEFEDVVAEISRVAEACLEVACRAAVGDLRLAVVGLGSSAVPS